MVIPQEAMVGCHELGELCMPMGHSVPLPTSLKLLEVLKAAWKHHPGAGDGFCLGLEASAAALSEALSKSLPQPLG